MYIVGNWKMNMLSAEAVQLASSIEGDISGSSLSTKVRVWVAPPFTALESIRNLGLKNLKVGGQNAHWESFGAFTGEISALMLKDLGCSFAIVGHSERRQYFNESDLTVNKRVKRVLNTGLSAIVCVGETLEQRQAERTNDILAEQLSGSLAGLLEEVMNVSTPDGMPLLVAYEPVWAIGTGRVASETEIANTHAFIADYIQRLGFHGDVPILYGGSVKPDNIEAIKEIDNVGGVLVGGASLKLEQFVSLIRSV
jgi:triosephosphate isomerase